MFHFVVGNSQGMEEILEEDACNKWKYTPQSCAPLDDLSTPSPWQ
jgi:hypothetical protein